MKTTNFESKLEINNIACIALQGKGLPTTKANKFKEFKLMASVNSCQLLNEVLISHKP
jgi:hypothetical protein